MKPLVIVVLLLCLSSSHVFGQIKIGDNPQNINATSVLELESTNKVLVITRVSNLEMEAITPLRGGVLYNTDTQCLHYFNGTEWINLCDAVSFRLTNDPIENITTTISIVDNGGTINLEVAPNSIRSENIVDGGINGDDIQNNSIGVDQIGGDAVGANELRDNSVSSIEIVDRSIRPEDMANANPNQVLTTNATGIANWVDASTVSGVVTDITTITGTGISGDALAISDAVQNAIVNNTLGIEDNTTAIVSETARATAAEAQNAADINDLRTNKEDVSNKDPNTNLGTSDDAYPTQNAVKTYVDNLVGGVGGSGDITSNDLVIIGGVDTAFNDVTLEIAAGAVGTPELANDAITNLKILNGTIITEDIANNSITPDKIEQGAPGNILTTDAAGDVVWQAPTVANVNVDGNTIIGNGSNIPLTVPLGGITSSQIFDGTISNTDIGVNAVATDNIINKNVTPAKIQNGADGEVLTTNATGDVIWALPALGNVNVDETTIQGNGNTTNLFIPDGGVTTTQIANGTITTLDIAPVTPNPTSTQILSTSTAGNVEWIDLPSGSVGTTELADQVTITGDGSLGNEFTVTDAGISPIKVQPSTIFGRYLRTDATGTVIWDDLPTGASGTVITDNSTILGDGLATALAVPTGGITSNQILDLTIATTDIADNNVTPAKLEASATDGQVLITNGTNVEWGDVPASNVNSDGTLIGNGNTVPLGIADDAVTTIKILDDNVTPAKLEASATDGQVLITNGTNVEWGDVPAGNVNSDGTLIGNGNTVPLGIADDAVTTIKILDDNVTPAKLEASATDGQVLITNGTNVEWTNLTDPVETGSILFSDGTGGITENNAQLFWNNTTLRFGVGLSDPDSKLHVNGQIRASTIANGNGTSGLPSYRFIDDLNSGMWSPIASELAFSTNSLEAIRINTNQNVGIGTTVIAAATKLHVVGNSLFDGDVTITAGSTFTPPDYVFESYFEGFSGLHPNYKMASLDEIEAFTRKNKHLPGIPSAKKILKEGLLLNQTIFNHLEKIEELFLHTIEQEKKINELQQTNEAMAKEVELLKAQMEEIKKMVLATNKN